MFNRKDLATLQREAAHTGEGSLKRVLGPVQLIALGIGCIIGAGIFVMTGTAAAEHAGPALMISFIIGAIACGFAGLCYAELSSVIPVSGSAYTYSYATMGELVAWIVGWCLVLEYGVASATVAVGWSGYFVSFLKDFGIVINPVFTQPYGTFVTLADGSQTTALFNAPAFFSMLVVTGILMKGIKESANLNNIMVAIKLIVILVVIAVGAFYVNTDNWFPFIPEPVGNKFGWSGVLSATTVIFFAYIGFDAVSTAAQEAKNPQRDMPIGILGSLLICTVLYIAVVAVLTGVVHYSTLNVPDPIAVAVDAMEKPWLSFLVKIGAVTGLFSVMLVCTYSQIRINYVMAKDGLISPIFAKVHAKNQTPYQNTAICGLLIATVAAIMPLGVLGTLVSVGTILAFAIACVGVLYLKKTQPDLHRPFKTPFMPWVPIGGILCSLAVLLGLPIPHFGVTDPATLQNVIGCVGSTCLSVIGGASSDTMRHFIMWMGAGLAVYALYGMRHSKLFDAANCKISCSLRKAVGIALALTVGFFVYKEVTHVTAATTIEPPVVSDGTTIQAPEAAE